MIEDQKAWPYIKRRHKYRGVPMERLNGACVPRGSHMSTLGYSEGILGTPGYP